MDEREGGVRATLNLGHTFGHAIETWQNYTGEKLVGGVGWGGEEGVVFTMVEFRLFFWGILV